MKQFRRSAAAFATILLCGTAAANGPDSWSNDLPPLPATVGSGAGMVRAGDYLYALPANNSNAFYRLSPGGAWTELPGAPGTINVGGVMTWDGGDSIYASGGYRTTTLWKYSIGQNAWVNPSGVPAAPFGMGPASELSCGNDGMLYLISGEYPGRLARYDTAVNRWETLPDSNDVNSQQDAMVSMPNSDTVYIFHARRFRVFSKSQMRWDVDALAEAV